MALAIVIGIIIVLIWLGSKGKKARASAEFDKLSQKEKADITTTDDRRRKQNEELITVILPTIDNDSK